VKIQINWCFDFKMTYIWSTTKAHSNNVNNDKTKETTKDGNARKKKEQKNGNKQYQDIRFSMKVCF
jgi:hypothetical protein